MKSPQNKYTKKLESGAIKKKWQGKIPIALVYPNFYKIAMGNLAIHNLYSRLNSYDEIVCERVFLPEKEGDQIRSIESNRLLSDFEVIFITVSFENDFSNFIEILNNGGVEIKAADRSEMPFIVAGGPAATINPWALSKIADAICVGEVDDKLDTLIDTIIYKRCQLLPKLSQVDGFYVPSRMTEVPKRHFVENLDDYPVHTTIDAPNSEFGKLFLIEIGRGCSYACKYCTVPSIYKPFRARSVDALWEIAKIGLSQGKRLGLVCPEVLTHPSFKELVEKIIAAGGEFSTSSIRADHIDKEVAELLSKGGMKSVSLGIEAGRVELRKELGKVFSDDTIISAINILTETGFKKIKLYFMIGLPNETEEDLSALVSLSERAQQSAKKGSRIEVVLSPFVPKPGTQFENSEFAGRKYLSKTHNQIRTVLGKSGIKVSSRTIKDAEKEYLYSRQIIE